MPICIPVMFKPLRAMFSSTVLLFTLSVHAHASLTSTEVPENLAVEGFLLIGSFEPESLDAELSVQAEDSVFVVVEPKVYDPRADDSGLGLGESTTEREYVGLDQRKPPLREDAGMHEHTKRGFAAEVGYQDQMLP